MTLTEQEPLTRVHEPPGAKDTFPFGIIAPDPEESVTTAEQLVAWFTTTLLGLQVTVVVVALANSSYYYGSSLHYSSRIPRWSRTLME